MTRVGVPDTPLKSPESTPSAIRAAAARSEGVLESLDVETGVADLPDQTRRSNIALMAQQQVVHPPERNLIRCGLGCLCGELCVWVDVPHPHRVQQRPLLDTGAPAATSVATGAAAPTDSTCSRIAVITSPSAAIAHPRVSRTLRLRERRAPSETCDMSAAATNRPRSSTTWRSDRFTRRRRPGRDRSGVAATG